MPSQAPRFSNRAREARGRAQRINEQIQKGQQRSKFDFLCVLCALCGEIYYKGKPRARRGNRPDRPLVTRTKPRFTPGIRSTASRPAFRRKVSGKALLEKIRIRPLVKPAVTWLSRLR